MESSQPLANAPNPKTRTNKDQDFYYSRQMISYSSFKTTIEYLRSNNSLR